MLLCQCAWACVLVPVHHSPRQSGVLCSCFVGTMHAAHCCKCSAPHHQPSTLTTTLYLIQSQHCCKCCALTFMLASCRALQLTLPAAPAAAQPGAKDQQQQQPLYRTMRLLPLSSSGVCVLNAALPGQWGNKLQEANPPGTYWFFEILLTVSPAVT